MTDVEPVLTKYQATYGGQEGGVYAPGDASGATTLLAALVAVLVIVLLASKVWSGHGRHHSGRPHSPRRAAVWPHRAPPASAYWPPYRR